MPLTWSILRLLDNGCAYSCLCIAVYTSDSTDLKERGVKFKVLANSQNILCFLQEVIISLSCGRRIDKRRAGTSGSHVLGIVDTYDMAHQPGSHGENAKCKMAFAGTRVLFYLGI